MTAQALGARVENAHRLVLASGERGMDALAGLEAMSDRPWSGSHDAVAFNALRWAQVRLAARRLFHALGGRVRG